MKKKTVLGICLVFLLAGCQTGTSVSKSQSPSGETASALGTVTEGLTNQSISAQDLKRLGQQVQKDPQAQSAVKAINASFNVQDTCIKYCPVDGKRYSCNLEYCPEHKVKLLIVQ